MLNCFTLDTQVFNFWYLTTAILTLIVIFIAGLAGWYQLVQIKKGRELEFLSRINEKLFGPERFKCRGEIYNHVPHPSQQKVEYGKWLQDVKSISQNVNRYNEMDGIVRKIEEELANFEIVGTYIREGKLNKTPFLSKWFDVLARLSFLLADWIVYERTFRGDGYLQEAGWLFHVNCEYLEQIRKSKDVGFFKYDDTGNNRVYMPISFKELMEAIDKICPKKKCESFWNHFISKIKSFKEHKYLEYKIWRLS